MKGLPDACELCSGSCNDYVVVNSPLGVSAARRCECPRGRALAFADLARSRASVAVGFTGASPSLFHRIRTDRLSASKVEGLCADMGLLRFFPTAEGYTLKLFGVVCRMASEVSQVEALVDDLITYYNNWPGFVELRFIFCSRFTPCDGRVVRVSEVYPDWPPPWLLLAVRRSTSLDNAYRSVSLPGSALLLSAADDVETVGDSEDVADKPVADSPAVVEVSGDSADERKGSLRRITQADVDAALAKLRAKKSGEGQG